MALGLLIGKPVGVLVASWIGVRLGICSLPAGVTWRSMAVVGVAAGIGFTMAIFIAELAFPASDLLAVAKLAVLGSTAVAGVLAYSLGRLLMGRGATAIAEVSEDDLEETAARAGESRAAPGAR